MNDEIATEIQYRLGKLQSSLKDMDNRVGLLERMDDLSNSVPDAPKLFDALSPKQHAILQLLLMGHSNRAVGQRIGTTIAGGKSAVTHLMTRLGVTTRSTLKAVYTPIFDTACANRYLEVSKIDKAWGSSYGLLNYIDAEGNDPYFDIIVKTRYRALATTLKTTN